MPNEKITVLMATRNGAHFLKEQLDSIAAQILCPAQMIISDDGSTDATRQIISNFAHNARFAVTLVDGPQMGLAENMLSLLRHAPTGNVAFADQDDVWLPAKLARASFALSEHPANQPVLYTARRMIADVDLNPIGISQHHRIPPTLANALVQNIAPSNTIVLNTAAFEIAQAATSEALKGTLPFHDWWLYQLITGSNGNVVYDPTPVLYYRQHSQNYLGAGVGVAGRITRLKALFDGSYRGWIKAQAIALERSRHRLDQNSKAHLTQFLEALQNRRLPLRQLGVFRQSRADQLLLHLASYLKAI